jgi:ER membrane protein complex subunit 1
MGPLKESEKLEGLAQYSELIPSISYAIFSHRELVEDVTSILTAPTDLESQSLVLAYGGPDLYFSRVSPTRGFDLLPESFSRPLLSLVLVGLLILVAVLKVRILGLSEPPVVLERIAHASCSPCRE